ncbi:oxidoreductase [Pseudomonas sp. P105]|uniref:oxidoreductase n=1 Tax=Pseudomonas sp. P105 TaxID=3049542 RepID=UPI0029350FBE|nr:oxidoreductase [Pseudomonas sp. P105]WNZ80512.1 oxidoreductase [Pseudomonas sp. P105]
MNTHVHKIILITGVSSGFGLAFSQAVLAAGHTVVGTVRRESERTAFEALDTDRAKAVVLDVTDYQAIEPLVAEILGNVGRIDVLVNNAGYGHEGILEESPLTEMQRQFATNVFGAVAMIKAVLPGMRERRNGHIVNITSMAGFITLPGIAYYSGSKFALEGISEALAKEVEHLGIHVTAMAPGSFRTEWAGRSMIRSVRTLSDYDSVFDPLRKTREEKSGKQTGDPHKAAQALLALVAAEKPPIHLLLGQDALRLVREKIARLQTEIAAWERLSESTDFD